jgi:phage tail-like protein
MADISTYVRYLPPVLWEKEPAPPAFSLGAMLRIFEKILTGIDDGVPISSGGNTYQPISAIIDRIPRLFDPYLTPAGFLPWLAGWLDLQVSPLWDEYQTRKVIAGIVQVYRKRGLKSGMIDYLDLYTVAATRPRIAIDNGSKVLFSQPQPRQAAPISTLVSQGPFIRSDDSVAFSGLFQPSCIALAPDGSLFVGDFGAPGNAPFTINSRVWHLSATGQYDLSGEPPQPASIGPPFPNWPLIAAAAIAVIDSSPWELYVLDETTTLYRLLGPTFAAATNLMSVGKWPVAMAVDNNGDILILDRGQPPGQPAAPTVISVTTKSLVVTPHALKVVVEPLSLLVLPGGDLVIGDGGVQKPVAVGDYPGNLVQVDRTNPLNWVETVLLPVPPNGPNPLVAPTAVVSPDASRLLVLDVGLKPFVPDPGTPFTSDVAEPAAVWRVDLTTLPPTVTLASETGYLVYPRGMVLSNGTLYICDPGMPQIAGIGPPLSRVLPHRFSVILHFGKQRLPSKQDQEKIRGGIGDILAEQKGAQTLWNIVTEI